MAIRTGRSEGVHAAEYVLDVAQLIDVLDLAPLRSWLTRWSCRVAQYAGIFPEKVHKLVAIEGMKIPDVVEKQMDRPIWELTRQWIAGVKASSSRTPRRYATIDAAAERMQEENPHLSQEQARHLTIHGVARNEDGTFSWKFDNAARPLFPQRLDREQRAEIWQRSTVRRCSSTAESPGTAIPRPTAAPSTFRTTPSSASTTRATGSTTTSSKASWKSLATSSGTDPPAAGARRD